MTTDLRRRHHHAGELAALLDAEMDRQRADAHAGIAFDGLEIVERHDAVRADAVERGKHEDGRSPAASRVITAAPVNQGRPS